MKLARYIPTLVLAATVLMMVPTVQAQVDPQDMVSGTVLQTQNPGTYNATLYTVPADKYFVLTDLNYSYLLLTSTITTQTLLTLRENSTDKWVWKVLQSITPAIIAWPVEKNFSTGIVFEPGSNVVLNQILGGNNQTQSSISWSGYLAPTTVSQVEEKEEGSDLALRAAPNPSQNRATLQFSLERPGQVLLAVYDVRGREVRVLHRGVLDAGPHTLSWDGRDDNGRTVPDGTFFARLTTEDETASAKLQKIR